MPILPERFVLIACATELQLGWWLRLVRKRVAISRNRLSHIAQVSPYLIHRYELGACSWKQEIARRLLGALSSGVFTVDRPWRVTQTSPEQLARYAPMVALATGIDSLFSDEPRCAIVHQRLLQATPGLGAHGGLR